MIPSPLIQYKALIDFVNASRLICYLMRIFGTPCPLLGHFLKSDYLRGILELLKCLLSVAV